MNFRPKTISMCGVPAFEAVQQKASGAGDPRRLDHKGIWSYRVVNNNYYPRIFVWSGRDLSGLYTLQRKGRPDRSLLLKDAELVIATGRRIPASCRSLEAVTLKDLTAVFDLTTSRKGFYSAFFVSTFEDECAFMLEQLIWAAKQQIVDMNWGGKRFERLQKLLALAQGTPYVGERDTALERAKTVIEGIKEKINEQQGASETEGTAQKGRSSHHTNLNPL